MLKTDKKIYKIEHKIYRETVASGFLRNDKGGLGYVL